MGAGPRLGRGETSPAGWIAARPVIPYDWEIAKIWGRSGRVLNRAAIANRTRIPNDAETRTSTGADRWKSGNRPAA